MKNQKNNTGGAGKGTTIKRSLPFFVEFVKFATGFAVIIAAGLFTLHVAAAAMQ